MGTELQAKYQKLAQEYAKVKIPLFLRDGVNF